MIKASKALIAWQASDGKDHLLGHDAPPGSVAVGPLLTRHESFDWTEPFSYTGGASELFRRKLSDTRQKLEVMSDYYILTYQYGIDPYVVHRAFLHIEEYVDWIKKISCGPAKHEPCHDPETPYGRILDKYPEVHDEVRWGARFVWLKENEP